MTGPELVIICERAVSAYPGPTALTGSWEGELGVRLPDGSLVRPGIALHERAWGDYSSSYSSGVRVDMFELASGWLLKVFGVSWEQFTGEEAWERERWTSNADGTVWKRLQEADQVEAGRLFDTIKTPGTPERTVYVTR